jgi:hypothetical protein
MCWMPDVLYIDSAILGLTQCIYMSDLTEEDSVARSWEITEVRVSEAMWELG